MPSHSPRRRKKPTLPAPAPPEARDWAALPRDILFAIFLDLGPREIMRGADRACTSWRRVAVGEPVLWRRVDVTTVPLCPAGRWRTMARAAVDRASGQCEAFWGPCDDDLLPYLVERAPSLKSVHLSHEDTSKIALNVALLRKLPFLKDVDISLSYFSNYASKELFESICQACPHLNKIRVNFHVNRDSNYYDDDMDSLDEETYVIPVMCELRSLELVGYDLTAAGLMAILDNCPLLESLSVTGGCIIGMMDQDLQAKCARVKNLSLPCDSDEEYSSEEYIYPDDSYESDQYDGFY